MQLAVAGAEHDTTEMVVGALQKRGIAVRRLPSPDLPPTGERVDALVFMALSPASSLSNARNGVVESAHASGIGQIVMVLPAGAEGLDPGGEATGAPVLDPAEAVVLLPEDVRPGTVAAGGLLRPRVGAEAIAGLIERLAVSRETETFHIAAAPQVPGGSFTTLKRSVDIVLALAVVLALWWLMLLVWIGVRLQTPGPGIFTQQRVGRGEQIFTCYKFRTMQVATPNLGTHEVSADAVTPLGHVLRGTKIDELPQVLNVLRGEMSFVGPRPCLPTQTALIERRRARGVFDIVPGITGLAQVAQVDMSDPKRLADWDYRYLKLRTLPMDFAIMLRTALGRGGGDRTGAGSA